MKNKYIFMKINRVFKKEIRNLLFIIFSLIFYIFDVFFIKKKNLVVFTQKNNLYSDNSKSFFEYINFNEKSFEAIWLIHDDNIKEKIISKNKFAKVLNIKTFSGFIALLKAKTVVTSNSLHDFFPYFHPSFRKQSIQLWHGIKWSKQFEYPNNNFTKDLTIICSSSESHKEIIYKHNQLDENKVYVTGLPRNDKFFNTDKSELKTNLPANLFNPDKKYILYAPTHREDLVSSFFPFKDKNINNLDEFLESKNLHLYLRPHINDTNKEGKAWLNFIKNLNAKNISSLSFSEFQDINSFLPLSEILITDYSTIYTDALLFNIPSIFIPYDLELYNNKRGFVYKFEEIALGPKVFSQEQLVNSIKQIIQEKNKYINLQKKIKDKFHKYEDGNSSQRIMNILKSKINVN